jgi:hypothetical protein
MRIEAFSTVPVKQLTPDYRADLVSLPTGRTISFGDVDYR